MKPVDDIASELGTILAPHRAWTPPIVRRLATSDAENSTGLGPDLETVAS